MSHLTRIFITSLVVLTIGISSASAAMQPGTAIPKEPITDDAKHRSNVDRARALFGVLDNTYREELLRPIVEENHDFLVSP